MARTIETRNESVVSIEEFIDFVHAQVDLRDLDSIETAAPLLRGMANDRQLVVSRLNRQVLNLFRTETIASAQVIYLGEGRDFYLRANVWPSLSDLSSGRVYQDQFAYSVAHDHNYSFMTVGYHGPGYITEMYQYDNSAVTGKLGEHVELHFVERLHFRTGMVMLYEASRDVHTQLPPEDMSITLNFMISTPDVRLRDQYFFDLERSALLDYPLELDGSRRISVIRMAADVGDANTQQLLNDLAASHPCRRTRLAAYEGLVKLRPQDAELVWRKAGSDSQALVADAARSRLDALHRS
ncbi:MAG: hypothetical protein JWQ90_3911 [Hydrocarboniphaga sp.]|uniref:hypothetical protein n=1 Tax=Hydrocarboniphaga sp. TaxID=2033016 RepID=UPI0026176AED|nr:hypothetical protein [Hydrocarboniphaga sp.]MDB5971461.1 hypothetical protein [Hydrocarboniphaga sp.]